MDSIQSHEQQSEVLVDFKEGRFHQVISKLSHLFVDLNSGSIDENVEVIINMPSIAQVLHF
jgi:hypothetical protein